MRTQQVQSTSRKSNSSWASVAGQVAVLGVVVVTPWYFGGVAPAVQVAGGVALLAAYFLWVWGHGAAGPGLFHVAVPTAAIPIVIAMAYAALFLAPLPAAWHARISPQSYEYWTALGTDTAALAASPDLPEPWTSDRSFPLTLHPAGTRQNLALLTWSLAAFVLGALLFTSRSATVRLLVVLATVGVMQAGFGLVQMLTWNGMLFWRYPMGHAGQPFGSFVNGNHSASLMTLALAGAIGLAFWSFRSAAPTAIAASGWRGVLEWIWDRLLAFVVGINAWSAAAFAATVLIAAGVFASRSRGAIVAAVVGGLATVCIVWLAQRRSVKQLASMSILAFLAGVCGLVVLLFTEADGGFHEDVDSLRDPSEVVSYRVAHWRDGMRAAQAFAPLGSGLGTYRYVYRPQQRRRDPLWYYHAENQYLEAFTEAGWVGVLAMLSALALAFLAAWRLLLAQDRTSQALGVAGVFGLATQTLHAAFDFAHYMPAVAITAAVLFGAVSGRAAALSVRDPSRKWFAQRGALGLAFAAVAAPLALVWAVYEQATEAAVYDGSRYAALNSPPPLSQWRITFGEPQGVGARFGAAAGRCGGAFGGGGDVSGLVPHRGFAAFAGDRGRRTRAAVDQLRPGRHPRTRFESTRSVASGRAGPKLSTPRLESRRLGAASLPSGDASPSARGDPGRGLVARRRRSDLRRAGGPGERA